MMIPHLPTRISKNLRLRGVVAVETLSGRDQAGIPLEDF